MDDAAGTAPATAAAAAALERAVPMLVRWFTRSDVKRAMLGNAEPKLSWTDAWLLGRITDTGPLRLSELAAWQEVDRSTMTTEVRRLEDLGLVERAPHPSDGRAVQVSATRAGTARHWRTKRTARVLYADLVADWSEADVEAATQVARRLTETLAQPRADRGQ
jgi:DNA-binding MarR family transcriptional regulator